MKRNEVIFYQNQLAISVSLQKTPHPVSYKFVQLKQFVLNEGKLRQQSQICFRVD